MKKVLICAFCLIYGLLVYSQETIALTGEWECSVGDSTQYNGFIVLPGMAEADGQVWLRKSVYVPQSWKNQRATLFLERPYVETTVFVNGEKVLRQMSSSTPHQCDVTRWLKPGRRNTIVICVSNGTENRNGIAGRMELCAQPKELFIEKVRILPDLPNGCVHLSLDAGGPLSNSYQLYNNYYTIAVVKDGDDSNQAIVHRRFLTEPHIEYDFHFVDSVYLWDEFQPTVYRIGISLGDDYYESTFGMCMFVDSDGQLFVNGHPMMLRGTVESHFPSDSVCPTNEEEWEALFSEYKKYGLNHVRFQSYCPPEAAFQVADRLGLYLQVEDPAASVEESKRIIDTYGHHPSFVIMSANTKSDSDWEKTMKKYDPTKIYDLKLPVIASGDSLDYKQVIEENLRSKDCVGFLLSSFNNVKKGMTSDKWREFCSPVVALAKFPRTDYTNKDTLVVPVEVYNAMYGVIQSMRNNYYITDSTQKVVAGGTLSMGQIPVGKNIDIGTVNFPLNKIAEPTKLILNVVVGGTVKNHWDFWVNPEMDVSPSCISNSDAAYR